MFKRIAAVATAAAFLALGGATVANASTSVLPFGNSNTVVNQNGVDFFQATNPVWGAAVNAGPANSSDNNFAVQSSGPNSVRFELVGTNLCVADPGPGYGNVDSIVLRTCNGKQWQAFRLVNKESNGLSGVQSVATNQYITDNGQFGNLTGVADNRPCAVGSPCGSSVQNANQFDGRNSQLWRTGVRHFHPVVNLQVSQSQNQSTNQLNPTLDSVTYSYDVENHGSVPVNVNMSASEVATITITSDSPVPNMVGTYTATLTQNGLESNQLIPAHSGVVDQNNITLSHPDSITNVTGHNVSGPYDESLTTFINDAHGAHITVQFVETPSVTATANGHAVNNIHVTPATETATF